MVFFFFFIHKICKDLCSVAERFIKKVTACFEVPVPPIKSCTADLLGCSVTWQSAVTFISACLQGVLFICSHLRFPEHCSLWFEKKKILWIVFPNWWTSWVKTFLFSLALQISLFYIPFITIFSLKKLTMLIPLQMSSCALKPDPSLGCNWPREGDQVCSLWKELLLTVKHS